MSNETKPRMAPKPGEVLTYMGRKLTLHENGVNIISERKGRDPLIHPNFTRAMEAIGFASGLI